MDRHFENAVLGGIAASFRHILPVGMCADPRAIMPGMVRHAEAETDLSAQSTFFSRLTDAVTGALLSQPPTLST
jgi:hypothetical protein